MEQEPRLESEQRLFKSQEEVNRYLGALGLYDCSQDLYEEEDESHIIRGED